jgi:Toprim domain-containing protein
MNVRHALTFDMLQSTVNGKFGVHDVPCPLCGPERRAPANRSRKVLRVWHVTAGFLTYACARCGEAGYLRDQAAPRVNASTLARLHAAQHEHEQAAAADRLRRALTLWRSRQPLCGTIAERYLREARAYGGPLPPTLGFLPARGDYPPALIAAFGIPEEPEPGVIVMPDSNVRGVHITRLLPDGSDRERGDKAKIMIGHSKGWPIVLSAPTDGLALIVAEGNESTLSGFEATGLYAWAAGSASRMPALANAVPSWAESVTILADDDIDGRRHAVALANALKERPIEVRFRVFAGKDAAA